MINANELRVGNWVLLNRGTDDQTEVTIDIITIYEDENAILLKKCEPIPLTEEWLIRFGFKREDKAPPTKEHSQYFSKWVMDYKYSFAYAPFREDWGFYHSYTDAPKDEDNDKFDFISCGLKYVHQLQNLYFALTGAELTIK